MRDMPDRTRSARVSFANSCAPAVQAELDARRRDAAFLLVQRRRGDLPRRAGQGPRLRHRHLGHRLAADAATRWPASAPRRRAPSRRRRRSTRAARSAPRPSASATTSRRSPPTTRISPPAPNASARPAAPRRSRRWRRATRTTTRRRSSARCISPARSPRPTRPTRAYARSAAILDREAAKYPDHPGDLALPDPCLRRAAARRAGPAGGTEIRRPGAGCAACAAHAVAHLHPGRRLGGIRPRPTSGPSIPPCGATSCRRPTTPPTIWCTPTCSWPAMPRRSPPWIAPCDR